MKGLKCGGSMYVILVYDVNLETKDGHAILRKVFKTCKKYLIHIQMRIQKYMNRIYKTII